MIDGWYSRGVRSRRAPVDPGRVTAVACATALAAAALLAACGPRVAAAGPGNDPSQGPAKVGPPPAVAAGREVVLGEMCPEAASGRPAVSAVVARRALSWSSEPDDLDALVARGSVQAFAVLSYEGKRAGTFTVAGPVEVDTVAPVALGAYAGQAPCATPATQQECTESLGGCGVAVALVAPPGSDDLPELRAGGACVMGDQLLVDTDGDGAAEAFPIAAFLDAMRAPEEEVMGVSARGTACSEPRFTLPGVVPAADPRAWRGMDLVGVVDLDDDGKTEVLLQLRYGDKVTWAVYSATQIATRLSLVAEGEPWGR